MKLISGIQQIGIGIPDVYEAYEWYKEALGFSVPLFDDMGWAELMLPYTNGEAQRRHAVLAINMQGGGGLEIWQYVSRTPRPPKEPIRPGDLGLYMIKLKTSNIERAHALLSSKKICMIGDICNNVGDTPYFFFKDPYGNLFQMIEYPGVFKKTRHTNGGICGAVIGVSDVERSLTFYHDILGYDRILYDETSVFDDYKPLCKDETVAFRRVGLTHSQKRQGAFSRIFGDTQIELLSLVEGGGKRIYENRLWGDLGFIHLCFDVLKMDEMKALCEQKGYTFTVDSDMEKTDGKTSFDMGKANGRFAYIEDPDGCLIEFVETHRIPIVEKLGLYINLKKRNPFKPLPDFILKLLDFGYR